MWIPSGRAAAFLTLLIALVLTVAVVTASATESRSFDLSAVVPAGQWKGARLKNLGKGVSLQVVASSEMTAGVAVLDAANYALLPAIPAPLFRGKINKQLSFAITIPGNGDYYLVIDNQSGTEPASVQISMVAAYDRRPAGKEPAAEEDRSRNEIEKGLGKIPQELAKLFMFAPFAINAKSCGKPNLYSSSSEISLCLEFVQKIQAALDNKEKSADVLLFALLHEVGHLLMQQWDYPFYDNEEVADEFAAILMILMGQKERITSTAEYFISNPSANELIAKTFADDRHPLSIQRARNVLRCLKDRQRELRWIGFFIPHLQSGILEKFLATPMPGLDLESVREELARRKGKG